MKSKFINAIAATLITTSIISITPIKVSAETIESSQESKATVVLSEEEINEIESNRDIVHANLSELGLSEELIDELIDRAKNGEILDSYKPEMDQFATTRYYGDYIIKDYPDGSVKAITNTNPKARGSVKATTLLSSSSFHKTYEQIIQGTNGISTITYSVTWTDNISGRSTISTAKYLGSANCQWGGYLITDYNSYYELLVYATGSFGGYSDRSTISTGSLVTYN